jgi:class 3 adenylate cyclase/pimeloyl-ACP methyl ester carboxylesterase
VNSDGPPLRCRNYPLPVGEWGPQTRYAKAGDLSIAYQTMGSGPFDVVWVSGWLSNIEVFHEHPGYERFLQRLASFSRLIIFDKRGVGLSDPVPLQAVPTLEEHVDDVVAVLDAAGSERAVVLGTSEGGPLAIMFAVSHPKRTSALVLLNTFARLSRADDYALGIPTEVYRRFIDGVMDGYGTGQRLGELASPDIASDPFTLEWRGRLERQSASPATARALHAAIFMADVRHLLTTVDVPTLVLHRAEDRYVRVGHGRYLAQHIPGAKYVELPGNDRTLVAASDALDEAQEFMTGTPPGVDPQRILTTLLFTDVVESTRRATELGDARWLERLDRHDNVVDRQLQRFNGRRVKNTGDGVLATFDGPGRAIRCAIAIRDGLRGLGLETRAGLHTGEVEVHAGDIGGIAVPLAARVMALAQPGEVLVSSAIPPLVTGSEIRFDDRGEHQLRGIPTPWRLFAVQD